VLTGICVGVGTIAFFLLFQKGGPLSAVPMILAGGAALMAIAGIAFFKESAAWPRILGILLAITGLLLLQSPGNKYAIQQRSVSCGESVGILDQVD
jgi:bacterial/archaeal transporter family protein